MTGETDTSNPPPETKPGWWERTKTNVKNFFSHALGYIPRGIILTGMLFAGSALIETTTGFSALGVTAPGANLALKFAGHIALGSLISGVLGATMAPCKPCANQSHGVQPNGNPLLSENEVALGQKIAREATTYATDMAKTGVMEAAAPGSGLPAYAVGKLLGTQPSR